MPRYIDPVPQYLDGNGDPLVNAQLTFYQSGTNTPIVTYKDSAQTIPNTNPVPLTADGQVPNVFFSGLARVILTYDDLETGELGKQRFDKDPVGQQSSLGNFELWDTQVVYDTNDITEGSDGNFYISLTTENQGNNPTSSATNWMEIRFISVWNTNHAYATGEITQTTSGDLYKSLQAQSGNNPATDDGTNWEQAFKIREIELSADGDILDGVRYNIDATSNTVDANIVNVDGLFIVHNNADSTFEVGITIPAGVTIRGAANSVTNPDKLILQAGDTAQLQALSSTILEVV